MLQCSESGTNSFVLNCRPRAIAGKGTTRDVHNGTSSSVTEYTSFKANPIYGKLYILWTVHRDTHMWARPRTCTLFLIIHFTSFIFDICGNKMPTRCNRGFLLQILLLTQHVSGTIMPIIRSSRVLYKWLLPLVFGAWFSSCRYGVELRVVCPVCFPVGPGWNSCSKAVYKPVWRIPLLSVQWINSWLRAQELSETCRV